MAVREHAHTLDHDRQGQPSLPWGPDTTCRSPMWPIEIQQSLDEMTGQMISSRRAFRYGASYFYGLKTEPLSKTDGPTDMLYCGVLKASWVPSGGSITDYGNR